jgi:putative IMPACT (imprinted ancient) family translation regulator
MALTLVRPVHSELLIKKSRFLGCVQPVAGRAEALAVVESLRAQHPGAAHVCWALMAGGQSAANDDGEPGGTAGRPMLEVLRHQQLEGVLATVVRYFGGAALGEVRHGSVVEIAFSVDEDAVSDLRTRLNDAARGAIEWSDD